MTSKQREVIRLQNIAKREIKRLEDMGAFVPDTVKHRANAPLKTRYTERQMEAMRDLLSKSHIRTISRISAPKPVRVPSVQAVSQYEAKTTPIVYKRDKDGSIQTTNGRKEYDLTKMGKPKVRMKTITINDINAGEEFYKAAKRIEKHPSRETASHIYNVLDYLERASGEIIFPADAVDPQLNIMKYVPSPARINQLAKKASENEVIPEVAYNMIAQNIALIGQKAGLTEHEYAGKIKQGWETSKEKAGRRFSGYIKKSSTIETIFDFFENSGKNWQAYRKRYGSDDFMMQFEEMTDYYDDREVEVDWEDFEAQIEKQTPVLSLFEYMRKEAERKKAMVE